MLKRIIFTLLLLLRLINPAFAEVNIVATLPWIGSIVREIGGDKVNITVLVKPNQDPHYIEAKPSMILEASKADMLIYNGLDLEVGYLPLIINSSRNYRIQAGRKENLDCSQYIDAIERPQRDVDRSMGDIHPFGNPHYHLSPENIRKVADGIADTLSELDSAHAEFYRKNLISFYERLDDKQKQWGSKSLKDKKFIAYHKYFEYLASEFGFQIIGYIEQKPGIPPSAGHIERLIETIKNSRPDALITTGYYGKRGVEFLSQKTGIRGVVIPHDVGADDIKDWFTLMDRVLESLE
ncbi:MAG: zinc ABC transporter substrate-binding protein [Nitrospinae bacterium]|nr:zinc ABC transporter substrate-binding protein [Nitrospinota bacterium]